MSKPNLVFRAGPRALARIRANGLNPADVVGISGAAGGPKWLVLAAMDRFLFGDWLPRRSAPLWLAGSSAGAWRFSAVCADDVEAAVEAFATSYIEQRYDGMPTPAEITVEAARILETVLGLPGVTGQHPLYRRQIITTRCRGWAASETPRVQYAAFVGAMLRNTVRRSALAAQLERVVFHDPRLAPPMARDAFTTHHVPLSADNLGHALMASGAIPVVMEGIHDPPGAPAGCYRDGGVIDCHMDLPLPPQDGVVLLPHFARRVVPGWFDKFLPWRHPQHMDDVLLIHPSDDFIDGLPDGQVPDRKDLRRYLGHDDARIHAWTSALRMGQALGEELRAVLDTDQLAARIQPL